jgi:hypothetical protein
MLSQKFFPKEDDAIFIFSKEGKNAHRLEAWGYTNKACLIYDTLRERRLYES